tara:strand:+ start:24207 stop:24563 length:357 start_codon:yes stop_codon:yes gene_type:complete
MPNPIAIDSRIFTSQKAAGEYVYYLRDKYAHMDNGVTDPEECEFLKELYTKYCEYDNWEAPGKPVAFFSRYIRRGQGAAGGTSVGFVVKFDDNDGTELEFSAKKAIQLVAAAQKTMSL